MRHPLSFHVHKGIQSCIVLLFVLSLFTGLHQSAPTQAQSAPISIVEQSTESQFRQRFIFRAKARSTAGKIVRARILWQTRATEASLTSPVESFTAASEVSLRFVWNTRWETTPPWQTLYYRWEVTDEAGNVYRSPRTAAEISDNTHDWQKLTDGKVAVYWYDRDEAFGKELLGIAQRGYEHVAKATGYTPEGEIRVVMYNDQEDFCGLFAPNMCRQWYAGVTFGSLTVEWLIPDEERFVMRQVVPHELAHAFLNDWLDGRVTALPRWFNEGQAVNNELEGLDDELARARGLARDNQLTRLAAMDQAAIEDRNSSLRVARWYAQSASLVAFLYERWGIESLGQIVERVRAGKRFDVALKEHTKLTMDEFELAWREWLGATVIPPTLIPSPTFPPFPPTPTYEPTPIKR